MEHRWSWQAKRARSARLGSALVAALIVAALVMFVSPPGALAAEYRIGALIPITGPAAAYGKQQEVALNIAVEAINAKGGINGAPLKLIIHDTSVKPDEAVTGARRLIATEKVLAIMGPFTSGQCEVVFPLINKAGIVSVTGSCASPGLGAKSRPFAFLNMQTSDVLYEPATQAFVKRYKPKRMAVIYDSKERLFNIDGTTIFPPILKKAGIEVVGSMPFLTGDLDFSAQVTKIKSLNPDGVVLVAWPPEGANILRELRKQGITAPVLGGISLADRKFVELAGAGVMEGSIASTFFWTESPEPKAKAFTETFEKRYGKVPFFIAATIYDAFQITVKLIQDLGIKPDDDLAASRGKLMEGWSKVKNYEGVMGLTTIGPDGAAQKEVFVLLAEGGRFKRLQ